MDNDRAGFYDDTITNVDCSDDHGVWPDGNIVADGGTVLRTSLGSDGHTIPDAAVCSEDGRLMDHGRGATDQAQSRTDLGGMSYLDFEHPHYEKFIGGQKRYT